jgi:hypothetical protein
MRRPDRSVLTASRLTTDRQTRASSSLRKQTMLVRTAPGFDGIGREYYIHNWEIMKEDMCDVINEMIFEHCMTPKQKHGVIICMPPPQKKNKEYLTQGLQTHNPAE